MAEKYTREHTLSVTLAIRETVKKQDIAPTPLQQCQPLIRFIDPAVEVCSELQKYGLQR